MESALIRQCSIKVDAPDIGGYPGCASARNALAGAWRSGAGLERAPRLSYASPAPLLTNHPLVAPVSGYYAKKRDDLMSAAPKPIRILTVDDHPLLREGIAALIASQPDMKLVGEASNGREALEQFRQHRPDITLMDLQMPEMKG